MSFWVPPIVGAIAAMMFVVFVGVASPIEIPATADTPARKAQFCSAAWLSAPIHVTSSWNYSDSWATNVGAVGGALGGIVGAAGALTNLVSSGDQGVFTGISLLFGGAAVLAPVAFAAFSRNPDITAPDGQSSNVLGSVGGLFIAAATTLFAVAGELSMMGLLSWNSTGSTAERVLVLGAIGIGAVVVGVYAARTLHNLATFNPAPPVPLTSGGASATAVAPSARSLLQGMHAVSGTL
jgi:hypothetical protein